MVREYVEDVRKIDVMRDLTRGTFFSGFYTFRGPQACVVVKCIEGQDRLSDFPDSRASC